MNNQKDVIPVNDIINTILDKKFKKVGHDGYANTEVDAFLDAICDAVEELQGQMENLRQKVNEGQAAQNSLQLRLQEAREELNAAKAARPVAPVAPVAPVVQRDTSAETGEFSELMAMAEKLKATIASTQVNAEQMVSEAQARVEAEISGLTTQRDSLKAEVAQLQETAQMFKDKMGTLLEQTREVLDSVNL